MAAAVTYNVYQQLGVDGLRGLSNFNLHSGVSAPRVLAKVKCCFPNLPHRNGARRIVELVLPQYRHPRWRQAC